ncbi:MAG: hypothetical protein A3F13_04420 [Gammaproteobacteria bacterium RIFCSPHIGHO2_12_FULL_40_19]|nr:MAG: hypothetical protein A3F13_04420 [Gammaproteobacteria bacterium RIFCSPHIGHO2_12_FULL_40_19]
MRSNLFQIFSRFTALDVAAKDAASLNNRRKAEELRKQGARIEAVALGIGIAGNWNYGVYLREQNPQCAQLANTLALGFEISGHHHFAMKIRFEENLSADVIALGMAIRGDKKSVQYLSQKARVDAGTVAVGAIIGGDILWAEFLRQNNETFFDRPNIPMTQAMAHVAYANGSVEYARYLQGTELNLGPSDTAEYARNTNLLTHTFFCSHRSNNPEPEQAMPQRRFQLKHLLAPSKPKEPQTTGRRGITFRAPGIFSHAAQVEAQKAAPHHIAPLQNPKKRKSIQTQTTPLMLKKQHGISDDESSDEGSFHVSSSSSDSSDSFHL